MKKIDKKLIQAYVTTINDFEIAIRNTGFFEFKQRKEYRKHIKYFEKKIKELENERPDR